MPKKQKTAVYGFVLFKTDAWNNPWAAKDAREIVVQSPHLADYWHANEAVRDLWEAKAAQVNAAAGVIPFTLRQTTGFRAFIAPDEQSVLTKTFRSPEARAGLNARKAIWKAMTKREQNEWYEHHKQPTIQAMATLKVEMISQESAGSISGLPRGVLEIIAIHMVRWEDEVKKFAPSLRVHALYQGAGDGRRRRSVPLWLARERHPAAGSIYSFARRRPARRGHRAFAHASTCRAEKM